MNLWSPHYRSRFLISAVVPITSLLLSGCGGGEDFSKPPAQIQNQLAKASQDPPASTPVSDAIAAKKTANSSKSVMGNAGGLLGSLKSDAAKKADAASKSSIHNWTFAVRHFAAAMIRE